VQGVFALTLAVAIILVMLGLSAQYFSINTLNKSFLDYRRAVYQSYLHHDVEYSLHLLVSTVRDHCAALDDPSGCAAVAELSYASFVSAWAANGVNVSGGGLTVLALPEGVDVRLATDLYWEMGEYRGKIPAGYGVG